MPRHPLSNSDSPGSRFGSVFDVCSGFLAGKSFVGFAVWVFAGIGLAGCDSPEPIRQYEIPRNMPAAMKPSDDRMLAAMVPHGEATWFFKVLGPVDAVDSVAERFREFVESTEFEEGEPVLDELPEGWRMGADKPMRFASIDIATENKQLDLSVSRLARQQDWDEEVSLNVNRWRGQVGLEPSGEKWAGAEPMEVPAADGEAVWVDLVGRSSAGPASMSPPFASGGRPMPGSPIAGGSPAASGGVTPGARPTAPGRSAAGEASPPAASASSGLSFDRPDGWRAGRKGGMRLEAFEIGPEESPAELTVIAAGGDLRGNVARWLGQIRPGGVPDEVVDEAMDAAESVKVDGRPGRRFVLTADPAESGTAIDATIVPLEGGRSLFIKMTGPYEIVSQEGERVRSFLESLKL